MKLIWNVSISKHNKNKIELWPNAWNTQHINLKQNMDEIGYPSTLNKQVLQSYVSITKFKIKKVLCAVEKINRPER